MTSGKHKSEDNDAIFEAYAQRQIDERGGFWDKQLANSPVMKKLAGNTSARAQGRVDSKQTANQITQAFYQSLGRNKGNVDTDQFKAWMGQAVGVDPQYLQSLGNVTKPQMSHGEIKKLIPDIVDQAVTAKQSGQAAKPGVAGMAQNTQVAAPQQQQTVAPPAGVTPPNPNSQPQQAAANNPNTPQFQAQQAAVNNPNAQPDPTNVQPNPNASTAPQNQNKPSLMSRIAGGIGKGVGNVVGGVAGGLAGGAIGGAVAGYNKGKNLMGGNKQTPNAQTSTDTSNQETQTPEPPSMQDLTKVDNKSFQDFSNSTDKSNIDDGPDLSAPEPEEVEAAPSAPEPEEVEAEPMVPGTTEPTTGTGDNVNIPTSVDVGAEEKPQMNQQDLDKEAQEIQASLQSKGYNQQDIERWGDPNNGLSADQIEKEMKDYQKTHLTPPPPPELTNNSAETPPPPPELTNNSAETPPSTTSEPEGEVADPYDAVWKKSMEREMEEAEDDEEREWIKSMMMDAPKRQKDGESKGLQERINRGKPGFIWK